MEDIKRNEVIEVCPLILVPMKEHGHIKRTKIYYYFFEYSDKYFAIVLGYGALYNHSYSPNSKYIFNYKTKTIKVVAIKNIKKGEEIFFNYNYFPGSQEPLGDWYKENV